MIMSIDFQFLYDNLIFFLKMNHASIILDVFRQISLLITSSFLSCSPFENDRKWINPPSSVKWQKMNQPTILKSSCDKHINSLPAVPGMSVPIKIFVCLRYRDCLESWTQLNSPGTAGRLSAVPGTSVPIKKKSAWDMSQVVSQVVSQALPPVP